MKYTQEELNLITLASFEELTYKNTALLLSDLRDTSPDFSKYENILIKSLGGGVYNKLKDRYNSEKYRAKLISRLEDKGIKCVTYFSEDYPVQLKNTPCPPLVLFCKGNTELLKDRLFAVVGSRRTLPNIVKECKKVSRELSEKFTVVSGLADGGDSAALEGALERGKAISVLAYGFDHVYPAVNEALMKRVEKNGLLITEYTPQVAPTKYNFPVRNRIIAGLCEGALIVSAGSRSGAAITAKYAFEYDRRVFVFPYTIGVASGEGCNELIKEGATLVTGVKDIYSDFGIEYEERRQVELSQEEESVLKLISDAGEAFAADVAENLGKLPFQIIPLLSALEIKGRIVRLGGNRYAAL